MYFVIETKLTNISINSLMRVKLIIRKVLQIFKFKLFFYDFNILIKSYFTFK